MTRWSKFSAGEIERRRQESVRAYDDMKQAEFARHYQKVCDRRYWMHGQCCAGCDHWQSEGGRSGQCSGAGIVSGADVMRSMGATFSSYIPEPGFPFTQWDHHCGLFKDEFDWSTLDEEYLREIGAMTELGLREKPKFYP